MSSRHNMVATKPVDFRRGADGLAVLVREQLRHDPFSGTSFVFRSKRAAPLAPFRSAAAVKRSRL